jgi:TonB family protein
VSQGLSGGRLLKRISPDYPQQARTQRIEGRVILSAMVNEDGSVSDVKVVQGPTVLAESAVAAVARWRFQPFLLNGKPIRRETEIKVDYKLP